MHRARLSHVSDNVLLEGLKSLVARDRLHSVELVTHLAEVERRKLYRPAGYPSLFLYCVRELCMSEPSAYKRIRAARVVRRFPFVSDAIADGRLHLDAVKLLAPHLTEHNVRDLVAAASHRTSREIEVLLATHFPKPDVPTRLRPLLPPPAVQHDPEGSPSPPTSAVARDLTKALQLDARPVDATVLNDAAPGIALSIASAPAHARVAPLSPGRFVLQVTLDQHTHDLLQQAKALLAAAQPACDVAQVLERALRDLVAKLEQQRFGDTEAPRSRRASCESRHVPAEIKRQVAARDGKRCTFVSEKGTRCPELAALEYDHVRPLALGGRSTVENLRLRCRAHNQFEAEQLYGAAFMQQKRDERRRTCPATPRQSPAP